MRSRRLWDTAAEQCRKISAIAPIFNFGSRESSELTDYSIILKGYQSQESSPLSFGGAGYLN